jgi:phospholipase/carboxylesterase
MAHGNLDPVVGHALGLMSRSYLEGLGYAVEWHSYPMPHSVSAEEIGDLSQWIGQRIGAKAD